MEEDAQDMVGGDQLVALVAAGMTAVEGTSISRRTKQDLEHARAEGKLLGRLREQLLGVDVHHADRIPDSGGGLCLEYLMSRR